MKKGWFYFVPIFFNPDNNVLVGRGLISTLFLDVMLGFHHLIISGASILAHIIGNSNYEPFYPIRITGDVTDE